VSGGTPGSTGAELALTPALEDYLETIFALVRETGMARVRDIASARGVKAGSVSPALARLAALGLVRYARREYVSLPGQGEAEARRVTARHTVLTHFFQEVLQLPVAVAERDACAIEHSLSDETMDRLVRLFEFLRSCPQGRDSFVDRFHACPLVQEDVPACTQGCRLPTGQSAGPRPPAEVPLTALFSLRPGERGRVARIDAKGPVRQRLLDMGILPDALIELERTAPLGDPIWIRLQGYQLSLRRTEAEAVLVRPVPPV